MKRILIVTEVLPPKYGGADIAALRYAEHLFQRQQVKVTLLGEWNDRVKDYKKKYPFISTVRLFNWSTGNWRFKRLTEIVNLLYAYLIVGIYFLLNRKKIDVVHSFNTWSNLNFAALFWGKKFGKKVITETCLLGADDPETILKKPKKEWFSTFPLKSQAFLNVDYFISKSEYITQLYKMHNLSSKTVQIPYFVDNSKFRRRNQNEIDALKHKYDLPLDFKVILFAGTTCHRKGTDILVKAFHELQKVFPKCKLILAGPFGKDEVFNKPIREFVQYNKTNVWHLNGHVDYINDLMALSDIYCLPTYKEGFPLSIIEAMCSNCLVIASSIPEIKDVQIKDSLNGFLIEPGNLDDLIKAFKKALISGNDYEEIRNCAYNEAHEKYSIGLITKYYLRIYN